MASSSASSTAVSIPPMYKYLLVVALGCMALHRLTRIPPPTSQYRGEAVGLGQYHIHDEVAIQSLATAADDGMKDGESRIILERVQRPDVR